MRKFCLMVAILLTLALVGSAAAQGDGVPQVVMLPMPDGVRLATDVYLPAGEGPFPVLLVRTPYSRATSAELGAVTQALPVAIVIQDARGRYDSEGTFSVFQDAQADGHATIEWITAQPWASDQVSTLGGSALGIAQYMLAPNAPEALNCQWMTVGAPDLYAHVVATNGVFREELVQLWLESLGEAHALDTMLSHAAEDAYWDAVRADFSAVNVPAVHIGGWYDIFARGTIDGFLGYQHEGGPDARGRQHLVMGPWTHDVDSLQVGELLFEDAASMSSDTYLEVWFQACLLGIDSAMQEFDALPAVTYYTMGAVDEPDAPGNEWRTADDWPPPGGVDVPLYLHPNGYFSTDAPATNGGSDTYIYDPGDPAPTIGGANLNLDAGVYDQRPVEVRDDVLVYSTVPLPDPVEITGDLRAELWVVADVAETDVAVRLSDVYPDGRSMLILDSIARFEGEPGQPGHLVFDLGPTSIMINAGHRLRVSITGANAPRFSPHPDAAQVTILHDAGHPSMLVLPAR